jgi:hypothetical protein
VPHLAHAAPRTTGTRPRLEIADIFRRHGEVYRDSHVLSSQQRKAMRDIEACRTAALGGHLDVCDTCGHAEPSYNSCRNRHCPKCQSLAQAKWIEKRKERILPTHYFHVVLTLPAPLRPLARCNPRRVFDLLFQAASATLLELGRDEDRLGATLGITAVLHTWTRELHFHPHLHMVVTGGGLSPDTQRWVPTDPAYLFPVKVLSRLFRGKFLATLRKAHEAGEIRLPRSETIDGVLAKVRQKDWVVYVKAPFKGAGHVYEYLGRYTHRVAISNQRLLEMNEEGVRFLTRNGESVQVPALEFIRRFLLHILPRGYVKIRHYGLLAASNAKTRLQLARQRLEEQNPPPQTPVEPEAPVSAEEEEARLCPRCRRGTMTIRRPLITISIHILAFDTS